MGESPSIDLGRERSIGEILLAALETYRRYPLLFFVLAAGVIAPYELARLAATGVGPFGGVGSGKVGVQLLLQLLDLSLGGPLISALHIHAVVEIGNGRRPRLGSVALQGLKVLPVVAAAEIVATMLIGLGTLALILPGILLALRWSVVAQTAAVDHEGWMPALKRSGKLTAGHYWHVLGLLAAGVALTYAVGALAGGASVGDSTSVGSVLVGIVAHTITASFAALTLALLYFDLRAREAEPQSRSIPGRQELRDLD